MGVLFCPDRMLYHLPNLICCEYEHDSCRELAYTQLLQHDHGN
jgi:hypothetical protein